MSKLIVKSISSIMVINGLGHSGMYSTAGESLENSKKKDFILSFLKNADTGINDIESTKDNLP
ncbi:hypothetical protein [Cloacibacterium sp.]|uniref:hypothetical protein n=1 Tax=Cloacibacterium sp. TaxID=1913682 RepID=UPI0035B0BD25